MKNSLKLVLLLAGVCALAAPVVRAEDPAPPPPPADHPDRPERGPGRRGPGAMWERVAKELNLTADQEAQWKEIAQQERAVAEPIFKDTSLSREEKRAKLMEANKPFAEQRRAVLTPDQQTKFDELQARMKARGERGERGPRKPKDE